MKDICCGIGPSIGACCYKVGDNVIAALKSYSWWQQVLEEKEDGTYLDLWQSNRLELLDVGLADENIFISGICTQCHKDEFFSYRGEAGKTGRMMAVMMLK